MKNKLRNSLTISVLAICGVIASYSGAQAIQLPEEGDNSSPDIEFSGDVTNMCAFGTPSTGTFGDTPTPDTKEIWAASGMDGAAPLGVPATINLACNGNADLAVSEVNEVSIPAGMTSSEIIGGAQTTRGISFGSSEGSGEPQNLTGPFNEDVLVGMLVEYTTAVKPGAYKYTTKLTATPQ
jgi:hypothetical protein